MKWTEVDEAQQGAEEREEKDPLGMEDDRWPEDERPAQRAAGSALKSPYLLVGVGAAALLVAVIVVMSVGRAGGVDAGRIQALEERIDRLQQAVDRFQAMDEKVTRIWEQAKNYEKFKNRFERTESSMTLRMDHLTLSLENLQKKVAALERRLAAQPAAPAPAAQTPAATGAIRYHKVAKGDTLFSISRKYNLTVDQLLKLNDMKKGQVIRVGQKLIVSRP